MRFHKPLLSINELWRKIRNASAGHPPGKTQKFHMVYYRKRLPSARPYFTQFSRSCTVSDRRMSISPMPLSAIVGCLPVKPGIPRSPKEGAIPAAPAARDRSREKGGLPNSVQSRPLPKRWIIRVCYHPAGFVRVGEILSRTGRPYCCRCLVGTDAY